MLQPFLRVLPSSQNLRTARRIGDRTRGDNLRL